MSHVKRYVLYSHYSRGYYSDENGECIDSLPKARRFATRDRAKQYLPCVKEVCGRDCVVEIKELFFIEE